MTVHLLKLCVGIDDVDQLARSQERRIRQTGRLVHRTRHTPRRADEVLDGGSIYWIIRGFVQVRQRIIGIHRETDEDGRSYCLLERDPELVRTELQPRRPHQGWRYLEQADAPRDMGSVRTYDLPSPQMAAELRELGLI
ncbi:MAG: DUF1489 domain-containing protein [Alphaproteobacteria bacterium]|nr:DUF1489 domain-containing protein [Alphaproteobacteria bacterium]